MTQPLFINGRFLGGNRTAVNAVAYALTDQLCKVTGNRRVEVVVPPALGDISVPPYWKVRQIGSSNGIFWEQHDLPKLRKDGIIAGFFNTVPLFGRGYVTMLHDAHVHTQSRSYGTATRAWRTCLSRRAGGTGNFVLTVSDHSKQELLRQGIGQPDRIGVVPNGPGAVTGTVPDHHVLERLGLRDGEPYCTALSTLLPHKNIGVLLRAFAEPGLADTKLVLFGQADRAAFETSGHDVPPNVIFAGFVEDAELATLYAKSLAVCMPSTAEGFGLPALEAMALGRPAIVAPCGALPEVVCDAGLVAAAHDPIAWADAITSLSDDKELDRRLSFAARTRASKFTWEAAGRAVHAHLDTWFPSRSAPYSSAKMRSSRTPPKMARTVAQPPNRTATVKPKAS